RVPLLNPKKKERFRCVLIRRCAPIGSTVAFVIAVSGTEPIQIQWKFNGTDIRNQTNRVLEINSVSVADSGSYSVVVSNSAGSDLSKVATLTVEDSDVRPSNDDFANRLLISSPQISVSGSNVNATTEPGEPNHANKASSKSVWWSWTASSSGNVTMSTAGSSFDTLLAVYEGLSLESLTTIASNDGDPDAPGLTSRVTFDAIAGVAYQMAVDGRFGTSGDVVLTITDLSKPHEVPKIPVQVATSGLNLVLAWPKTIPGIVIEESDDFRIWTSVIMTPLAEGDDNFLKLPILKSSKFYRLRQQ
ncbi:MAG: immunoglobulin domain-containing protein, partial [Verrucomicrobia bacterium]|nr:immunoglobulin domain-containing protein [Verrucomicrobiota bacterium]